MGATFLVDTASAFVAAAVFAVVMAVAKMGRNVRDTTTAVGHLTKAVADLQEDGSQTRERLAALEGPPWARAPWRHPTNGA